MEHKVFEIQINAHTTQLEQMAQYLNLKPENNRIEIPSYMGEGFLQYIELPYQIQLHHYRYKLKEKIEVRGINPPKDGLYMVNINLSNRILDKEVGQKERKLSASGGSGILFYTPGYHSRGSNELDAAYEVVFFAFPISTLALFNHHPVVKELSQMEKFCIYDELNEEQTLLLSEVLNDKPVFNNPLKLKGQLLKILGLIVEQFANRKSKPSHKLNLQDVEKQFKVKEVLLSHIYGNAPTLTMLAEMTHISTSKLKNDFKSVFGMPVYQYYLKKKMEIAKKLILSKSATVAEIGYQLGYSNTSQFSAQFKKHFGKNPSQLME